MKKTLINIVVVAIIIGGIAFYGGMKYGESQSSTSGFQRSGANAGGFRGGAGGGARGGLGGGGFNGGDIISKDDKSITIKLRDGGSKIIFYSGTTEIGKFVNGSIDDVKVGETVSVNGKANSDGSITADSIQIRPPRPSSSPQ